MLETILYSVYASLGLSAILAFRQLEFAVKHFTPPRPNGHIKNSNEHALPSVTVCIPARNEAHAMADCLERVLASTYPKLEILVLDDSSADDTSVLIKSFAHVGVRFIEGKRLEKGWLGKNFALEGLRKQASGTYVLFIDVDTYLAPQAISNMVRDIMQSEAAMLSVMPRREDGWRGSVLASPLRYFWELMFHRHQSPAAASHAWMINRKVLSDYGGFETLRDTFRPESHLAAYCAHNAKYRFYVSTHDYGVYYEKKWRSQCMTSIRMLYPSLGMQWASMVIAVLDLVIMTSPAAIVLWALAAGQTGHAVIAALFGLLFALLYGVYTQRVWAKAWWLAGALWPLIVIQEIVLIIVSAIQYGRRAVTWKGRPLRSEVQS